MNRRELVGGVIALSGLTGCQMKPLGAGDPLFVLKEQSPWRMAIGSESPTFALYDDGKVIYQHKEGFKSVALNRWRLSKLVDTLGLADLPKYAKHYEVAPFTDATTYILYAFKGATPSVTSIYGPLRATLVSQGGKPVTKLVAMVPEPLIKAFDTAKNFDSPDAKTWLPEKVEVLVWPYEYAPEPSIVWPKSWPDLTDPATRRRGDTYSIYVPSTDLPALDHFLSTQREKGAVEINGRKWTASLRYPFPREQLWESHAPRSRT